MAEVAGKEAFAAGGPSGVVDQSNARIRAAIGLAPTNGSPWPALTPPTDDRHAVFQASVPSVSTESPEHAHNARPTRV